MVTQLFKTDRKVQSFSCLEGGLPLGALIEFSGPVGAGKTELVLKFLSENPEGKVAWIEDPMSAYSGCPIYPWAFEQKKVSLQRVLFVETPRYLWAVQQVLKSQIFKTVILSAPVSTEVERRRLQIAAEKAGASVILIDEKSTRQGNWPFAVQLHVTRCQKTGMLRLQVVKYRGGGGQWEKLLSTANGR